MGWREKLRGSWMMGGCGYGVVWSDHSVQHKVTHAPAPPTVPCGALCPRMCFAFARLGGVQQ